MPSATFEGIQREKRERIQQALVQEFSAYPLLDAQVARIVAAAHISRGAFYVYFTDLADSYRWVLNETLRPIEGDLGKELANHPDDSLEAFFTYTQRYLQQLTHSPNRRLYLMHWQVNEAYLQSTAPAKPVKPVSHQFSSLRLRVQGHSIEDQSTNAVVIGMLTTLTHRTIQQVLNGADLASSMEQYALAIRIMRDGIITQQENDRVLSH